MTVHTWILWLILCPGPRPALHKFFLAAGLFWVTWFASKRKALMPQRRVYFVLRVLDTAWLYPDAGISWACVCLLSTPLRIHVPFPMPSHWQDSRITSSILWWAYQMEIPWQPSWIPLPSSTHFHTVSTARSYLCWCLALIWIQDCRWRFITFTTVCTVQTKIHTTISNIGWKQSWSQAEVTNPRHM